ncbi:MAG: sulfatase [Saprospiraceae bacterium]|nr:sulfatase [Saprospiraceae bacterium]
MRTVCLWTIILFSLPPLVRAKVIKPPNILFAFADDMGKYASCYAQIKEHHVWQDIISTPHMDRVAKEGVLFNNAFVNAPSCTPCRSSILSGQYFYRTNRGAILQGAVWDESIPTYPLMLEDHGYHIGFTYKVWSPGQPKDAGHGGVRAKYEPAGRRFCQFSQQTKKMVEIGKSVAAAKEVLLDEVRTNFQAFLEANLSDKPFCYWFGPTNTHRKWIAGSGEAFWSIDPDQLKGQMPPFLPDVDEVREDFSDYLGEVMAFDAGLGVLLDVLEHMGELENTFIVVSGDHGFPGITNGKCNLYDFGTNVPLIIRYPPAIPSSRIVSDFVSLMDLAPTFLDLAKVEVPTVMTGKSLMPMLKRRKSGTVDRSRSYVITGRERHVAKAREGNLPYPQRAIRTKDHLYIINFKPDRWPMGSPAEDEDQLRFEKLANDTFVTYADYDASPSKAWIIQHKHQDQYKIYYNYAFAKRPAEELYVLDEDPFQVNNVAELSKYDKIRISLRKKLLDELQHTGDPRVSGDGSTFDSVPYAGPYE